jgi:Rhs element Vgr protein
MYKKNSGIQEDKTAPTGLVTIDIVNLTDNEKLDPNCEITAIDILHEINKIPTAEITLLDDQYLIGKSKLSEKNFFMPGKLWEIKLRYGDDLSTEETVFKGFVIKHSLKSIAATTYLTVVLKSQAIRLTVQPRTTVYQHCLDSDMIKNLASTVLTATEQTIAPTTVAHEQLVQHQCTDWDFIVARADANGLWVKIEDETLHAFAAKITTSPLYQFSQSDNVGDSQAKLIHALEIALDISEQVGEVTSYAWDIAEQAVTEKPTDTHFAMQQGAFAMDAFAKAMGAEHCGQVHAANLPAEELSAWSNSKLVKSRLSLIRGYLTTDGFAEIRLGDTIGLKNINQNFDGNTLATGLRHRVTKEGWRLDVQFGMAADWFLKRSANRHLSSAAELLPAVAGLQIGIVAAYEEDEQGHYRVRVRLPFAKGEEPVIWARLASVYAGNKRGWYFYPEPGDEVVLGFFNDDPRQPVILGALYSAKNVPPFKYSAENTQKGLVTRSGMTLLIDEEQQGIQFTTPDNNQISMWDKGDNKGLYFIDKTHQHALKLDDSGVKIASSQQMNLESKGELVIKGTKVDIQ